MESAIGSKPNLLFIHPDQRLSGIIQDLAQRRNTDTSEVLNRAINLLEWYQDCEAADRIPGFMTKHGDFVPLRDIYKNPDAWAYRRKDCG